MSLNSEFFITDLIYNGTDSFADFAGNGGLTWIEQLLALNAEGIVDPVTGTKRPVHVLFVLDGAARREFNGVGSAATTFPLEYNTMDSGQSRNVNLVGPTTRTAHGMKQAEPPPGLSAAQLQTRARDPRYAGVRGANLLRCAPSLLEPDVLHLKLRVISAIMQHTARFLLLAKCDLNAFCEHLFCCCGVRARILFFSGRGPEVCISGESMRALLAAGEGVVECTRQHRFLPTGEHASHARSVLRSIWSLSAANLLMLSEVHVDTARRQLSAFRTDAVKLGFFASAAFGTGVITPSVRTLMDIVSWHMEVRPRCVRLACVAWY